jgi:8-oxo-dGTP pyrophosphatase MutT (NUDIX family)
MIPTGQDALLQIPEILPFIIEKLGNIPVDFSDKISDLRKSKRPKSSLPAAGVLLLLNLNKGPASEHTFLLIKRSASVSQPGDLSCPGGMLHAGIDPILRTFLLSRLNPIITGKSFDFLKSRDADTQKAITLFLANAIRETWEEINLCPFKISFLGPLPTYSLRLSKTTIFPLVGAVQKAWRLRPNSEVDRIVEIPLKTFFDKENYATCQFDLPEALRQGFDYPSQFPCLIFRDNLNREEILWGATFKIIMTFLGIVFNLHLPEIDSGKIVYKEFYNNYSTVRHNE